MLAKVLPYASISRQEACTMRHSWKSMVRTLWVFMNPKSLSLEHVPRRTKRRPLVWAKAGLLVLGPLVVPSRKGAAAVLFVFEPLSNDKQVYSILIIFDSSI